MLQRRKNCEAECSSFERDLLEVLKNEPDHRLVFDRKLLFRSRRFECLLAAVDVHYEQCNGDVVMIGIHRFSGSRVPKNAVVSFSECYDDLRLACDNETKLLAMVRKAVYAKYLDSYFNWMKARGFVKDSVVDLVSLDVGSFRIESAWSYLLGIGKDKEGNFNLLCYNSIADNFNLNPDRVRMSDLQILGNQLADVCEQLEDKFDLVEIVSEPGAIDSGSADHAVDEAVGASACSDSSLPDEPDSLFRKILRLFGFGR